MGWPTPSLGSVAHKGQVRISRETYWAFQIAVSTARLRTGKWWSGVIRKMDTVSGMCVFLLAVLAQT